MLKLPVYLDYHATSPCDQEVLDAMLPYFNQHFGNASAKGYLFGWQASEAVKIAREQVAALIGSDPSEIIFTSGATESVNLALKGIFGALSAKGKHIITSASEHRAVLDTCKHLENLGAEISYLPVQEDGLTDLDILKKSIRPDTILIAIMYANNETGVLQPVHSIGEIAKQNGILFFSDATQALGKVSIDVNLEKIDLLAFSAHKLYGPKGVGALYVRRKSPRVRLIPQQDGGGQEGGLRSGTQNVPGIVGFGKAAELAKKDMNLNMGHIRQLRDKLEKALLGLQGATLNGNSEQRLPTVTNISFDQAHGNRLITSILKDIAVSS